MLNKKFKVVTLGCRTNQYESQAYADQLGLMGYKEALPGELADICIVNTCTVTEGAEKSSRLEIRQIAKKHPGAQVLVTGCLAEQAPQELLTISGVTHVVSNKEKEKLLTRLFPEEELPEFSIQNFAQHTRAFVKVQDGCNSFCSYCIIPYVRGRSRSRTVEDVLREVDGLVHNGFKEVVLTGINIGDFDGNKKGVRLASLVKAVDGVPGVERVRLSSIDPDEVDDELLGAILNGKHTCPSLHIVLQSGSNVILKRMGRKYTRQMFLDAIDRVRSVTPDFTFTTDVIVGFPGETESDFEETLDMICQVRFAKVHMFPYSARARTRAALFPGKVAPDVIAERKQRLMRLAEQVAYNLREDYVGRVLHVLLESCDEGVWSGHTENFLPVQIPDGFGMHSNKMIRVKCVENGTLGLQGVQDEN